MQNDDLKTLLSQMYNNLLDQIDAQEQTSKEQVVNYINDVANVISNIDEENSDSLEHEKALFTNAYKEIANKSLSSYATTNERFQKLTKMHETTLNACHDAHIDLPSITEKFNNIQSHMVAEVQKANSVISELTQQVKKLESTSNLDPLTKVLNRRALTTQLNSMCSKDNKITDMHLLMLDIDDFKIINDEHGHIAGDKVLIFITNILKKTLRAGDKIYRYGGEEFIILLNRIDDVRCKEISSRLLELVRKNNLIYKGNSLKVTMSMGTTKLHPTDTPDTLVARADKALYKAKENGKNQIYTEV